MLVSSKDTPYSVYSGRNGQIACPLKPRELALFSGRFPGPRSRVAFLPPLPGRSGLLTFLSDDPPGRRFFILSLFSWARGLRLALMGRASGISPPESMRRPWCSQERRSVTLFLEISLALRGAWRKRWRKCSIMGKGALAWLDFISHPPMLAKDASGILPA